MHEANVIPSDDTFTHEDSDDCPCGPELLPVMREDGSVMWALSHHALTVEDDE